MPALAKYNLDLNYLLRGTDISDAELVEIIAEADRIILENKVTPETLAGAYLKKSQCLSMLGVYGDEEDDRDYYEESKEAVEKVLELYPDMAEAIVLLGDFAIRPSEAIVMYTKAIELKPDYAAAYCKRGFHYHGSENYNQAMADYSEAIRLKPDYADAYRGRGTNGHEYNQAIADLTEAIRLKPNYVGAFYNRGSKYLYHEDYDKAIADFTEIIRLIPDDPRYFNKRGRVYVITGEYYKAISDFTEVIQLRPDYVLSIYYNRGIVYDDKGEYEKAITDYTEAIRPDPEGAGDAYFNRGLSYAALGQNDKATADYVEAKRLELLNRKLVYEGQRARCFVRYYNDRNVHFMRHYLEKHLDRTFAEYTEAIRLHPDNAAVFYQRGRLYDTLDQFDKAISDYTEAIHLDPVNAEKACYDRGRMYESLEKPDEAAADYDEALRLYISNGKKRELSDGLGEWL